MGDETDVQYAVTSAKSAFPAWSQTSKAERIALLNRMHEVVTTHQHELLEATILEYGAPVSRAQWMVAHAAGSFLDRGNARNKTSCVVSGVIADDNTEHGL